MNRARLPYRRILLPVVLALTLAAESIAVVAAVDLRPAVAQGIDGTFAPQATRPAVRAGGSEISIGRVTSRGLDHRNDPRTRARTPQRAVEIKAPSVSAPVRPSTAAVNKAKSVSKAELARASSRQNGTSTGTASKPASSSTAYKGRNHMWFPALGINRSVTGYACRSTAYPGDRVYRWGCAGRNNVYLFGHAHSVFKPLHDAYVRGRLKKGMKVMYADANGRVSTYRIAWWKVTTPGNGAFAYAGLSSPSMTLQTCVGAKSEYRLIVRLTRS